MQTQTIVIVNLVLTVLLLIISAWLIQRLIQLDKVRKEFFSSGLKKDFEQVLVDQNRSLTKINQELNDLDDSLNRLYTDNRHNLQKVGFVRFNPFDDAGGNMSFAIALLDVHDDGVVISSLHGREGTRIYSKLIKAGASESKLTEEEIQAIQKAH